ncbi:MAG TPA: prepilin-type N-terminal cleavage/methylation domain-containing protein [Candidatus Saccharimonadales bacterium]|nr:prepilin-type N-terminal cleavage/methylation domain-containing protein [Candidatus Saccharimonadales bacterium]
MSKRTVNKGKGMQGFTIVELMMATLVFSVILLMVTIGVLQVNRVYYKGVTETNTQNTARGIMDTISQAIQFNGGTVGPLPTPASPTPGTTYYVCVNNQQFIYRQGFQLVSGSPGTHQTNQAFLQKAITGACGTPASPLTGRELLSPNMRLSNLQVTRIGTSNLYKVQVTVTYGDDDVMTNPTSLSPVCKGIRAGNQFCSVSTLSTVVEKRIN